MPDHWGDICELKQSVLPVEPEILPMWFIDGNGIGLVGIRQLYRPQEATRLSHVQSCLDTIHFEVLIRQLLIQFK